MKRKEERELMERREEWKEEDMEGKVIERRRGVN